jgi:ferric-dicitrate binding protein FerR (iron transport regulator)
MLREQVRQAQEREARLLTMLETAQQVLQAEQQARRDLETKLLPAPRPARTGKVRVWALAIVLLVALAALVAALIHPEIVGRLTGG